MDEARTFGRTHMQVFQTLQECLTSASFLQHLTSKVISDAWIGMQTVMVSVPATCDHHKHTVMWEITVKVVGH